MHCARAQAKHSQSARQTVIAMEQNRYSPSLETAFLAARVFGVPLEDVFQFEYEPEKG